MGREKVIKGWECHMEADTLKCADCPYREGWRTCNFADTLFKDVYALLKEQEEIIRCKDCYYYHKPEYGFTIGDCTYRDAWYPVKENEFCSLAKRKEGR